MTDQAKLLPIRVLVVENDHELARALILDLGDAGLRVNWASTGLGGLQQTHDHHPHLILLDLDLPDLPGAEVVRRLRLGSRVPIMVLSSCDAVADKVRLLALGANDYLVRPVHPRELLARVWAQLRSGQAGSRTVGGLTLHGQWQLAQFQGRPVPLTHTEYELLAALASQPGRVFTRFELMGAVWHGALPLDSNVVDMHLTNLRAKLRAVKADGLIRTVRGVGFALRA